jgi:hypothetical protein
VLSGYLRWGGKEGNGSNLFCRIFHYRARKQVLVGGHYELGGGERTGVDLFRLQFHHRARYRRGGDHFSKGKGDTVQDLIGSVLYREVSDSIGI